MDDGIEVIFVKDGLEIWDYNFCWLKVLMIFGSNLGIEGD